MTVHFNIQPRIETLSSKKLIGKRLLMCLSNDKTGELWRSFMIDRAKIKNVRGENRYSMQLFVPSYFETFNPDNEFEKWAAVEVVNFDEVPQGMEATTLPEGLYAVFLYKGSSANGAQIFQYILGSWLPQSAYILDNRPHFEVLGEKYRNNDPDSEEEIWIPVRERTIG